jgi:hypothetical protein
MAAYAAPDEPAFTFDQLDDGDHVGVGRRRPRWVTRPYLALTAARARRRGILAVAGFVRLGSSATSRSLSSPAIFAASTIFRLLGFPGRRRHDH